MDKETLFKIKSNQMTHSAQELAKLKEMKYNSFKETTHKDEHKKEGNEEILKRLDDILSKVDQIFQIFEKLGEQFDGTARENSDRKNK